MVKYKQMKYYISVYDNEFTEGYIFNIGRIKLINGIYFFIPGPETAYGNKSLVSISRKLAKLNKGK